MFAVTLVCSVFNIIQGASDIFASSSERKAERKKPYTEDDLMKKIGCLEAENDFFRIVSLALGPDTEKPG